MKAFADSLVAPLAITRTAPFWSWGAPLAAAAALLFTGANASTSAVALLFAMLLLPVVLSAVHHAEVIAVRVGEPFGTLVLALAVTVIECALIITVMLANPLASAALLRDTVFSAVMIILGGVVGLCITVGAARHRVQRFGLDGVTAALTALAALAVLVLVLPNYTTTTAGPTFSGGQLLLVGAASLALWLLFVFVQTIRHRDYFLPQDITGDGVPDRQTATGGQALLSLLLLLGSLGCVVLLARALSEPLGVLILSTGAPLAAVGVVIAGVVLLPESIAAVRAARADRLQTSLNLALGSALATIGLTVPVIVTLSLVLDWQLVLGLDGRGNILLALMLFISSLSLATGRTTVLQGGVHLVIFAFFLFTSFTP